MDNAAGPSGGLALVAPAAAAPPTVVQPLDGTNHLLRLEHVRRRLVADTVALVSWDTDALRVVSLSGARLSGSTAVAVGVPCVVLDCFAPVREDYAELMNRYIPGLEKLQDRKI